jgi:hypothetical protein
MVKPNTPPADRACEGVVGGRREVHESQGASRRRAPAGDRGRRWGVDPAPARVARDAGGNRAGAGPRQARRPGSGDPEAAPPDCFATHLVGTGDGSAGSPRVASGPARLAVRHRVREAEVRVCPADQTRDDPAHGDGSHDDHAADDHDLADDHDSPASAATATASHTGVDNHDPATDDGSFQVRDRRAPRARALEDPSATPASQAPETGQAAEAAEAAQAPETAKAPEAGQGSKASEAAQAAQAAETGQATEACQAAEVSSPRS